MKRVRIIGAGPAGSATAIRLARAGLDVTLYEKTVFPRAKLCGGFLSGEAWPELESLGIRSALESAGAPAISRVVVTAPSGQEAGIDLRHAARAISRRSLDSLLLNEARASGAHFVQGDGYSAALKSDWLIDATGRKVSHPRGTYCGIQAYFKDVRGVSDQVELHLFAGGYVGLVRHEDGSVNLCALLRPELIRRHGPEIDGVIAHLMRAQRGLAQRLREAHRTTAWLAVGPAGMGFQKLADRNTFFVGDAACVVDPFAGEGLTMSLLGARLLSEALIADRPATYGEYWHQAFDQPLRLQGLLRGLTRSHWLQEALVMGAQFFPSALQWLTDHTRAPLLNPS